MLYYAPNEHGIIRRLVHIARHRHPIAAGMRDVSAVAFAQSESVPESVPKED